MYLVSFENKEIYESPLDVLVVITLFSLFFFNCKNIASAVHQMLIMHALILH